MEYLPSHISSCRYTIAQEKAISRAGGKKMRSPKLRRKGPWNKDEEPKPETKVFRVSENQKISYRGYYTLRILSFVSTIFVNLLFYHKIW